MRATAFEFRYRSLINLAHLWLAFQVYVFDHVNVVMAVARGLSAGSASRAYIFMRLLFSAGALLVGLAAAIRTWAAAYLRSSVVHDPQLHRDTLLADGPYRHVRNPLYLGSFLWTMGLGFLASRLGFVILAGVATLRILRLIRREEAELGETQGKKFREYCRRVPRLLPALTPRVPAGGIEPRWGQAFQGEAQLWCCLLAMLAVTITLRLRIGWIGLGAAFGAWLVQHGARYCHRRSVQGP